MSDSFSRATASSQAQPCDQLDSIGSRDRDLAELRAWINRAIEEQGWNHEALAAHMHKDRAYISRVLSGEKPLSAAFMRELPDDIELVVAKFYAQAFGLIVVAPLSGPAAIEGLVGGLVGLLMAAAPQLPVKASVMVRAALPGRKARQA